MDFTRRDFVKFGGFAAIAVLGFSDSAFAANDGNTLANQTSESFRQLIGTEFYVWNESLSKTSVRMSQVQDFPNRTPDGECFSIVFETHLREIKQATYNVFHPSIGEFELFMTEGKIGNQCALIATINRI